MIGPFGEPDAGERIEGLADGVEEEGGPEEAEAHVYHVVQVNSITHSAGLHFLSLILNIIFS